MKYLDKIQDPSDLKRLDFKQRLELCNELRTKTIEIVSKTGGHLASNLGIVELTVAIDYVFNLPKDKVIYDVGHQSYIHKMLSGRLEKMETLRKYNGLAGFPKSSESIYDAFNTGHSSTSISAALGYARARDIMGDNYRVICVIGDGSLTSGMALEALNDAAVSNTDLIVIVNDNEMSISPNEGGLAAELSKLRSRKGYTNSNRLIRNFFLKIPFIGVPIVKITHRVKTSIKRIVYPNMHFEDLGYTYLGPVDGNNLENIEAILHQAKDLKGPILIHVNTKKGKGYKPAEDNPDAFHGVGSFNIETGEIKANKGDDYSKVFGDKLCEMAKKDKRICAITAAMTLGTGLKRFASEYPKRFFDVEICEEHAITLAAGLAKGGCVPVVPIYSSFIQRAYDQIIHDVAMQNLHVVICLDRAGIVGADGETHQGMFDLSFRNIPNLTIMAPSSFKELEMMLEVAVNDIEGAVIIRYPRGKESSLCVSNENVNDIKNGLGQSLRKGDNLTLLTIGKSLETAIKVADKLKEDGIMCDVIDMRYLAPLNDKTFKDSIIKNKYVITIEDAMIKGGLHSAICEYILDNDLDVKVHGFAYDDFMPHGTNEEIEKLAHVDDESILSYIKTHKFYKN